MLITLRILLQLIHEMIEFLLFLLSVLEGFSLELWVVFLEELFFRGDEPECECGPADGDYEESVLKKWGVRLCVKCDWGGVVWEERGIYDAAILPMRFQFVGLGAIVED